jgi:hypothetical protein
LGGRKRHRLGEFLVPHGSKPPSDYAPTLPDVLGDDLRRGTAELIGAFGLTFFGVGSIMVGYAGPAAGAVLAALLYEFLYLRPAPRPQPVGPPETGLEEPRPGDLAAS